MAKKENKVNVVKYGKKRLLAALLCVALVIVNVMPLNTTVLASEKYNSNHTDYEDTELAQMKEDEFDAEETESQGDESDTGETKFQEDENPARDSDTPESDTDADDKDYFENSSDDEYEGGQGEDSDSEEIEIQGEDSNAQDNGAEGYNSNIDNTEADDALQDTNNNVTDSEDVEDTERADDSGNNQALTEEGKDINSTYASSNSIKIGESKTLTDSTRISPSYPRYTDLSTTYVWSTTPSGIVRCSSNGKTATVTGLMPGKTTVSTKISLSYKYYDTSLKTYRPAYEECFGGSWSITVIGDDITVNFDANGGSVSPTKKTVTSGDTYGTLPTPTRNAHSFLGWYTAASGGTQITSNTKVTSLVSHTIYAHWAPHIEVTFDANGGKTATSKKTVVYGETYGTLPTPTRSGWQFDGWYTRKEGGTEIKSSTVVEVSGNKITLYAQWVPIYYITFDANGGQTETNRKSVVYGETYGLLPTPTRSGWVFDGWYTSPEGGTQVKSSTWVTITDHQILYAHWLRQYTITFHAMGGTISENTKTVTYYNAYGELPEPIKEGYSFLGWFTSPENGIEITADTIVSLRSNHILYAHWRQYYTITFDPNGGIVSIDNKRVMDGLCYGELPTPTRNDYKFVGWYTDAEEGELITETTFVDLDDDQTLYAHWELQKTYSVTFSANGGSGAPKSVSVKAGDVFTLAATGPTRSWYNFGGWLYDGQIYWPGDSLTVNEDIAFSAVWEDVYLLGTNQVHTIKLPAAGVPVYCQLERFSSNSNYWILYMESITASGEKMSDCTYEYYYNNKTNLKFTDSSSFLSGHEFALNNSINQIFVKIYPKDKTEYGTIAFGYYQLSSVPIQYKNDGGGLINAGTVTSDTGELTVKKSSTANHTIASATANDSTINYDANGADVVIPSDKMSFILNQWSGVGINSQKEHGNYYTFKPGDIYTREYPLRLTTQWEPDDEIEFPAISRANYNFTGWYTEAEGGTKITDSASFKPNSEYTLYAHWDPVKYTVHFDAGDGSVYPEQIMVHYGKAYGDLPVPTRKGYQFECWWLSTSDGDIPIDSSTIAEYEGDHTLFASWKEGESDGPYSVVFDTQDCGLAPAAYVDVEAGSTINAPEEPKADGYIFLGWYTDVQCTRLWDFEIDTVNENLTLYAGWKSLNIGSGSESDTDSRDGTYVVIFDTRGHGTAISAYVHIVGGSTIEAPEEPVEEGYRFIGWYKDGSCTIPWDFETDTVDEDITLYACWLMASKDTDSEETDLYIQEIYALTYTGNKLNPPVTVYSDGGSTKLKAGKDYTIKYFNNIDADKVEQEGGTSGSGIEGDNGFTKDLPYVVITGKGNYMGTIYTNFHILPASISDNDKNPAKGITLKCTEQFASSKKALKPFASMKYKKAMKAGKDYIVTLSYASYLDNGAVQAEYPVDSESEIPKIPAKESGIFLLTLMGIGNYTGTIEKVIYVADKNNLMKNAVVTLGKNIKSVQYNGEPVILTSSSVAGDDVFTVRIGRTYLDPQDYTVSYKDNNRLGTATMIIKGKDDYLGTKSVTFKIKGTNFTARNISVEGFQESIVYTGKSLTQDELILRDGDTDLQCGKHYSINYKNNLKKGTATITFKANPAYGYSGSFKKKFKITAASLDNNTVNVTASDYTVEDENTDIMLIGDTIFTKAGAIPSGKIILTNSIGVTLNEGKDYTVKYTDNKTAGSIATMTVNGKGNYSGTLAIKYTITKASLENSNITTKVTAAAFNNRQANGDYQYRPKIKIMDGKKTLTAGKDYIIEAYENCSQDEVSAYLEAIYEGELSWSELNAMKPYAVITATEEGDYKGTILVDLTIYDKKFNKNNLDVYIYKNTDVYDGNQVKPLIDVEFEGVRLIEGEDYTVTYGKNNVAGKNKGSITITGIGIYGGNIKIKFTIRQKNIYTTEE